MRLPHKTLERKLFDQGYKYVFGVDEVGMGCLAGPVVVCAVLFNKNFFQKKHRKLHRLRDSKLLLPHQREKFAKELLKEKGFVYAISSVSPRIIDKINIYQAARLGMARAVKRLANSKLKILNPKQILNSKFQIQNEKNKIIVLVDGKTIINGLNMDQMPIVKGDRRVFSIACASIIAKVFRDKMMRKYARTFPQYGFEKHKGYGTKLHKDMLIQYGICAIHRKSFTPVAELL